MSNQSFSIIGATGSVLDNNFWHAGATVGVSFSTDLKTVLRNKSEKPTYAVLNSTTEEFTQLDEGKGHEVSDRSLVLISSQVTSERDMPVQITVLEYDEHRDRSGQQVVKVNQTAEVSIGPATKYVVFAIRLGAGDQVRFESLAIEVTENPHGPAQESSVKYLSHTGGLAHDALEKLADTARRSLDKIVKFVDHSASAAGKAVSQLHADPEAEQISRYRAESTVKLLSNLATSLPDSNGSRHFNKIPLTAAIITDEYMFNFYKDVFESVHYLSPSNYESVLNENSVDVIFYVTCWRGMDNDEWKGVKFREKPQQAFQAIIDHAKAHGIPTVFQSIEDPSNFEYFLPVASVFDWVFTSDSDMVDEYKKALGHDRVAYGEYGANPQINNPIGSFRHDLPDAFFAGSYPERYPERCADMEIIFDSLVDSGTDLTILDRNFALADFNFPDRYKKFIHPAIPHAVLQKMHRLYRYSLNFNSIKGSPTMCAMRVYELQAQGKPLISNYARSVFNTFPDVKIIAEPSTDLRLDTDSFPHEAYNRANKSLTAIMSTRTSYDVVGRMMETVGLIGPEKRSEKILVLASANIDAVERIVSSQSVSAEVKSFEDVVSEPHVLDDVGYVTVLDPDLHYEHDYLLSRMNAFKYTDSDFVTQEAVYEGGTYREGRVHEFTTTATDPATTMVASDVEGALEFLTGESRSVNGRGYLADAFGIGFTEFIRSTQELPSGTEPLLTVIIPVHNNGRFLETKCIPSLQTNRLWNDMEILLVDDDSSDPDTIRIEEELLARYPNISIHRFHDGGSGSASRPRNWGIDHAKADLITFLDPDNEISPAGYDNLYDEYRRLEAAGTPVDFISGYQVKVGERTGYTGRHMSNGTLLIEETTKHFFANGNFPTVSTQAAIIRRDFLKDNTLNFVEKSAGQDTLFGWELAARAKAAAFTSHAFLIYYAEREGSITNSLNPSYFDKCEILEKQQVTRLDELGLLDTFKEHRLESFMVDWYLPRLELVPEEKRSSSRDTLARISQLYGQPLEYFETIRLSTLKETSN